jgi:hypothetical protein
METTERTRERLSLSFPDNDWQSFSLQISWEDADGFTYNTDIDSTQLSAGQLQTVASIAAPLIALDADWVAKHVYVVKETVDGADALLLTAVAEKEKNGLYAHKVFTSSDLDQLRVTTDEALDLFDSLFDLAQSKFEEQTAEQDSTEADS